MRMMQCTAVAAAYLFSVIAFCGGAAAGEDRPLIWTVAKTGSNAYTLRAGVKWTAPLTVSAGTETAIAASSDGALQRDAMPVKLWGHVDLARSKDPASNSQLALNGQYEAVSGNAAVSLDRQRKWIATPSIDIESSRSLTVRAGATIRTGVAAAQTVKVTLADLDTSMFSEGTVGTVSRRVSSRIGIERSLFDKVTVSASIADPLSRPRPTVLAGISRTW